MKSWWPVGRDGISVPVVEEFPAMDVRWLQRAGILVGSHCLEWTDGSTSRPYGTEDRIDSLHWPANTDFLLSSAPPAKVPTWTTLRAAYDGSRSG